MKKSIQILLTLKSGEFEDIEYKHQQRRAAHRTASLKYDRAYRQKSTIGEKAYKELMKAKENATTTT